MQFLIPFVEGNVEQQISDVSSCLADGELVALLTKAILTHDDCSQLEKILALLLHEHIVTGRCGTHASAQAWSSTAEDILTRSSTSPSFKIQHASVPVNTDKQLSPHYDPTRAIFGQHLILPSMIASQLFKHCVAELTCHSASFAKNLVILYKLDKYPLLADSIVTLYSCSEQTWASEARMVVVTGYPVQDMYLSHSSFAAIMLQADDKPIKGVTPHVHMKLLTVLNCK